jgi:hypothetical protein
MHTDATPMLTFVEKDQISVLAKWASEMVSLLFYPHKASEVVGQIIKIGRFRYRSDHTFVGLKESIAKLPIRTIIMRFFIDAKLGSESGSVDQMTCESGSSNQCSGSVTFWYGSRIRRSIALTSGSGCGSGSGSCVFRQWPPRCQQKIFFSLIFSSVADPGCLSRIPDPDFYPSRIPDLGSRIQKQ